jgi:hypothetical protein
VSVNNSGAAADGGSYQPAISGDGRFVAFGSTGSNLVVSDTNDCVDQSAGHITHYNCPDIFVRDRVTRTTERVNVGNDGTQANDRSQDVAINADGRFVAFASLASNLVGADTNETSDVFVRDRETGTTTLVSVGAFEMPPPLNLERPSLPSSGRPGQKITCTPGAWLGDPTFGFAWTRDATPIAGQQRRTYTIVAADVGHELRCTVSAHNTGGDSGADSNPLSVVKPLAPKATALRLRPWPARAGKRLDATMTITIGGRALRTGRVTCNLKVGVRALAALAQRLRGGSARCVWKLPESSQHKRLVGSLTATTRNGTARRTFEGIVR